MKVLSIFSRADREGLERAEARVAGAEVVDRQHHAEPLQFLHGRDRLLDVLHDQALGELELEEFRASRPLSLERAATMAVSRRSWNCRAETLTLIRIGGRPRFCHASAWRQASFSTHSPIGAIRPVSSASGMKRAGGSSPRLGWFQRISASTPKIAPRAQVDLRLIVQHELLARQRERAAPRAAGIFREP